MNFDDLLKQAWQGEHQLASQQDLTRRVRRQQMRLRAQRGMEVALTLAAVLVFARALLSGNVGPSHRLMMPFFVVFIPVAWVIVLRAPRRQAWDAMESASIYARLRLSQLRTSLRDLCFARTAAAVLFIYAVVANITIWLAAASQWREAGLILLAAAVAWWLATRVLIHMSRRRWLREYRAVRRLVNS